MKSATFSGTTTSVGQLVINVDTTPRIPIAINFDSAGSAHSGYGFIYKSGANYQTIIQLVGGTISSQAISGTYYYTEP